MKKYFLSIIILLGMAFNFSGCQPAYTQNGVMVTNGSTFYNNHRRVYPNTKYQENTYYSRSRTLGYDYYYIDDRGNFIDITLPNTYRIKYHNGYDYFYIGHSNKYSRLYKKKYNKVRHNKRYKNKPVMYKPPYEKKKKYNKVRHNKRYKNKPVMYNPPYKKKKNYNKNVKNSIHSSYNKKYEEKLR